MTNPAKAREAEQKKKLLRAKLKGRFLKKRKPLPRKHTDPRVQALLRKGISLSFAELLIQADDAMDAFEKEFSRELEAVRGIRTKALR